jgi:hypothetical protein
VIELIEQMLEASKAKHFHIALVAALVLPDICAALESTDGQATGAKYKAWTDKWLSPKYGDVTGTSLSGDTCYYYRCAVLHQNRSLHPKLGFERVAFLEPNGSVTMHDCVINNVLVIDIPSFCQDMSEAVSEWLRAAEGTVEYKTNVRNGMQRFPSDVVGVSMPDLFVYA